MPDVPAGLSGLTDRVLPYAFPTLDGQVFSETLARSVQVESPPPQAVSDVATSFEPLSALTRDGFYRPGTEHRTCVLVDRRRDAHRHLVERRLQASSSSGWGLRRTASTRRTARSTPRTGPRARRRTRSSRLARAAGSRAYSEGDVGAAAAALRRLADVGPSHRVGTTQSVHALAPIFAALALVAVALDLVRRYLRPAGGVSLVRRHRKDATVGV